MPSLFPVIVHAEPDTRIAGIDTSPTGATVVVGDAASRTDYATVEELDAPLRLLRASVAFIIGDNAKGGRRIGATAAVKALLSRFAACRRTVYTGVRVGADLTGFSFWIEADIEFVCSGRYGETHGITGAGAIKAARERAPPPTVTSIET
jgi:hypothetical protein